MWLRRAFALGGIERFFHDGRALLVRRLEHHVALIVHDIEKLVTHLPGQPPAESDRRGLQAGIPGAWRGEAQPTYQLQQPEPGHHAY